MGGTREQTREWALTISTNHHPKTQGRLTDPLVVGFVDMLVNPRMVFQSMDPIDEEIRKEQIKPNARDEIRPSIFPYFLIQLALSPNLAQEPREGHHVDYWRCDHRRFDF